MDEDRDEEFIEEWWYNRPSLRKTFAPLLYLTSWQYRLWRFLQKPPEQRIKQAEKKAKKIRKKMDFPGVTKQEIVGREEEFNRIIVSAAYHIFRDKEIKRTSPVPPPKVFILKGSSGSGKSFFAEACQREVFEEGLKFGTLVNYASLKPENVYTMWYGRSARQLGAFFQESFQKPSIILIDEFQAFGSKFSSTSEVGMEEKRVQTVFLERIDDLQKRNYRTILLISTNEYESITDTLRRRGLVGTIDLDSTNNRLILLEIAERQSCKYGIALATGQILDAIEDALRSVGGTKLTPSDIVNAFEIVVAEKLRPIQKSMVTRIGFSETTKEDVSKIGQTISLGDFKAASRKLKTYVSREKTEAAKRAVNRIAPRERYRDIGGLHGVRDEIIKEISLSLDADLSVEAGYLAPKGFIFYGPPGTGKTLLAKAIAGENDVWFYSVSGPSILQGRYGDPEKTVRDIFDDARRNAPAIVFFDEIDSIAPKRGTHDPILDRVVSQLLTEIDGFTPLANVAVIGATNRFEIVDPALLERLPRHFEFLYPKNKNERKEIIDIHIQRYSAYLDKGISLIQILNVFEKKILSPRKIADAIDDANRMRTKELEANRKILLAIKHSEEKVCETRSLYRDDLDRLYSIIGIKSDNIIVPEKIEILRKITPSSYPLRICHFEKALEKTTDEFVEETRGMLQQTIRGKEAEIGKTYGLIALGEEGSLGGLVGAIEVVVNPRGKGEVQVVGSELGESIFASAQDAFIYINSIANWQFKEYDVYVELVTPAKGMEKHSSGFGVPRSPVSGPSAGIAIGVAMLSAFLKVRADPTVIMTGAITAKGEVWPVGGLDYRGMGKIEAALSDKYARKIVIPTFNYLKLKSFDTEKMLSEKGIKIVPVRTFLEAASESLFDIKTSEQVIERLNGSMKSPSSADPF